MLFGRTGFYRNKSENTSAFFAGAAKTDSYNPLITVTVAITAVLFCMTLQGTAVFLKNKPIRHSGAVENRTFNKRRQTDTKRK